MDWGPDPGLKTYSSEGVTLMVSGVVAERLPVTFAVGADELKLPRTTDEGQEKAAGVAAAISGAAAVGSTAAAGQLARLGAVAGAFDCPGEGLTPIAWEHHPLLLLSFPAEIGDVPGPAGISQHASAVVGNTVLLLAVAMLLPIMAAVPRVLLPKGHVGWRRVHGRAMSRCPAALIRRAAALRPQSMGQSFALIGFPSRAAPVFAFLCPGSSLAGATLLIHADSMAWKLAGTACIAFVAGGGSATTLWCTRRGKALAAALVDRVDQWPHRGRFRRLLLSDFEWWCWSEPTFVGRCKLFFKDYIPSARWFLCIELAVSAVYGISNAVRPTSLSNCRIRSWGMLGFALAHLAALLAIRPYRRTLEQLFHALISLFIFLAVLCVVINQHSLEKEHWSMDAGGRATTAAVWLITIKCVLDVVILIVEALENMRGPGGDSASSRVDEKEVAAEPPPPPSIFVFGDPESDKETFSRDRSGLQLQRLTVGAAVSDFGDPGTPLVGSINAPSSVGGRGRRRSSVRRGSACSSPLRPNASSPPRTRKVRPSPARRPSAPAVDVGAGRASATRRRRSSYSPRWVQTPAGWMQTATESLLDERSDAGSDVGVMV
eukprot:TRINITY_DN2273_c1_g2_i2.p1 TRINITY_DN2273_c1_g2~~TRINITY_DN2273_c1_g2_i2.p1  ORF type:complete len:603 (+),score=167.40 TRINITY_DN2273_c1_g2_i2:765-2573(+)